MGSAICRQICDVGVGVAMPWSIARRRDLHAALDPIAQPLGILGLPIRTRVIKALDLGRFQIRKRLNVLTRRGRSLPLRTIRIDALPLRFRSGPGRLVKR